MKILTLSLVVSALTFACGTRVLAQERVDMFVIQPCRLDWKDIPVTHSAELNGSTVSMDLLPKTATRKTAADITPKEWKRIKKRASRRYACSIVVYDDYRLPKQVPPDPEKEARLNSYIHIHALVPTRPCPECPQPKAASKP